VSLLGGPRLVARRRPGPQLGQEQSPMNFPEYQTSPHDKPMARTKAKDNSFPMRSGQRRKARGWETKKG
jgi:hypothetical protein